MDYAVADKAFEDLTGGGLGDPFLWQRGGSWQGGGALAHGYVHGFVGEAVGLFVSAAEGVFDLKLFQFSGQEPGLLPEGAEGGAGDFVLAFELLDHELGVGDDAEALYTVAQSPVQDG